MKQILTNKKNGKFIGFICVLLLMQTSLLFAADDITGEWEIKMDFGGRNTFAALSISKNADGKLSGKWGRDVVSDVNFQDNKLTFIRTVGREQWQFTMNFEATLKDGKLTGTLSSDRGQNNLVGYRPKPMCPALGQWDVKFSVADRDINALLTISKNPDDTLAGQWTKEEGEHIISDVKFQDGKLTFNRKVNFEGFEFETPFEGTIEANKLTGMFKNEMGQWEATGSRVGAQLVGKWELTTTFERGPRTQILTIFGDMTGRYESFGGYIPIKDLKLEGDQLTFSVDVGFGDWAFQMDFKGMLKGDSLTGQFTSPRGTRETTGKKIE